MPLDPAKIVSALRLHGRAAVSVQTNWPLILAALDKLGINSDLVQVAAAATVMVETAGTFQPINEFGGKDPAAYFTRMYEHRTDLGNVVPGDGALFHGRGFIQITGRANYHVFGEKLGLFLEDSPDKALEPDVAAQILALFFVTAHVAANANARNWRGVRIRVNGGTNGMEAFLGFVDDLLEVV